MKDISTTRHASRYLVVGISLALFNFGTYTFIARVLIQNNDLLWLSNFLATFLTTLLAYLLHSKITWKERHPGKSGVINFFLWNALLTFIISPGLTYLFGLITPLYEFIFNISENIHFPFDYSFIESTSVFLLVAIVTTILNFFFYDRFVFGKKSPSQKTDDKSFNQKSDKSKNSNNKSPNEKSDQKSPNKTPKRPSSPETH